MAEAFVGLTVELKLKAPERATVHATVAGVRDQHLILSNVHVLETGARFPNAQFSGAQIADIEVIGNDLPGPGAFKPASSTTNDFVDPAILTFARTPAPPQGGGQPKSRPSIIPPSAAPLIPPTAAQLPFRSGPTQSVGSAPSLLAQRTEATRQNLSPSRPQPLTGVRDSNNAQGSNKQKPRVKTQRFEAAAADQSSPEISTTVRVAQATKPRSAGWRQTPLLEEIPQLRPSNLAPAQARGQQSSSVVPLQATGIHNNKKSKKEKAMEREARKNGWATEDATDVQEMGDFDFAENLAKFDKKSVWNQLREEDTTADEDRLVSFNRLDRKLRPTENVLDAQPTRARSRGPSSFGIYAEYDDENEDLDTFSSRPMLRNLSRSSTRLPIRRESSHFNSAIPMSASATVLGSSAGTHPHVNDHLANLSLAVAGRSMSHPNRNSHDLVRPAISPTYRDKFSSSPVTTGLGSAPKHTPSVPRRTSPPRLRYMTDGQKPCPIVTPEVLSAIEAYAFAEPLHLSTDVLAENAARAIAELALSAINPGGRRLGTNNQNSRPVIVVLASDNECGARAIAAAAHLRERGIRVIASVLGLSAEDYLDVDAMDPSSFESSLGYQLRRFDGKVMPWTATEAFLKTLDAPPELIIDGLLDVHTPPATIFGQPAAARREAMDMVAWANKSRAACLALDIPSGVDATTGRVAVVEGEPAEIRARIVVACGIPTVGLLRALQARADEGAAGDAWRVFVADIGLNPALRRFSAVVEGGPHKGRAARIAKLSLNFGSAWVVPLSFDPGDREDVSAVGVGEDDVEDRGDAGQGNGGLLE